MTYYSRKMQEIKNVIHSRGMSLPYFDESKWTRFGRSIYTNAYAYALDLPVSDSKMEIFLPGWISDNTSRKTPYEGKQLLNAIKEDLEFLGIEYRENTEELYTGEYRIAIYSISTPHDWPIDFSIARQDKDMAWSEKPSWKGKVRKIGETDSPDEPPVLTTGTNRSMYLEEVLILTY